MRIRLPMLAACLVLLAISMPALAVESCLWLPVAQVGRALPEFKPWQTMAGGKVGACQFLGRTPRGAAILSLIQRVEESPAKAEDFVASLRKNLGGEYLVEPMASLGRRGFSYRPKDAAAGDARGTLFLVGHEGRVVAMGTLTVPGEVSADMREGFLALSRRAFDLAGDSENLAAATRCTYFDQDLLDELFKGAGFSQQVYGANSCIANAGVRVLLLAIVDNVGPALAQTMAASGDCRSTPLPALGAQGSIGFACAQGNARAMVRYLKGGKHFEFSWIPGAEPSPAERELLVKLAQSAYDGVH